MSMTMSLGIPTLQQWLADTSVSRRIRSSELKQVDKAIGAYNTARTPENVGAIRIALAKWIEAKGAGWQSNDRNAPPKRPISTLFDLVQKLKARLPPEERAAVQHIIAQQQTLLYRNFQNAHLALPGFNTAGEIEFAKHKIEAAAAAAAKAPSTMAKAEAAAAANEMFGSQVKDAAAFAAWVAQEAGLASLEVVAQNVWDMLPFISIAAGAAKVLMQTAMTVRAAYKVYDVHSSRSALAQGGPQAAVNALMTLLQRELANNVTKTAITTAGFAANTALHAAKGAGAIVAPAVGAAATAAQAARVVALFAMQVHEAILMHKALKNPKDIGFDTIQRAPLLGCYLLVGASDSELLAITWSEFGQAGSMNEVAALLKDLKTVMDRAADVIQDAPFKLTGLPTRRATTHSTTGMVMHTLGWS